LLDILIDADACPVKNEVYRVARRYGLRVVLVAQSWMRVPDEDNLELVVVGEGLDAADDWIVAHAGRDDIVITDDIPLAHRCLQVGARVLSPRGRVYDEHSIGSALAMRDLLDDLRGQGAITGGPAPFEKRDRSQFLQRLDEIIQQISRTS
jgi:uncharacterized protein YaiI (UPF0178 family)